MRLRTRAPLVAAACAAALAPALAYGSLAPPSASVVAVDFAFQANGTDDTNAEIAPGGTVTFSYPTGTSFHNVDFSGGPQPASCQGLPAGPAKKGWSGSCTFDKPGTYSFVCDVHPQMVGTVTVEAEATPTPTASATPTPTATPTPVGATATPTPMPAPSGATTPTVKPSLHGTAVKIAAGQHGTRLRGSVKVAPAKSRLEVTVNAPRSVLSGGSDKTATKIGGWTKRQAAAGTVSFSIAINAKARSALRRRHKLAVTVSVALTPPGGHKLVRSVRATLRPS